MPECLCIKNVMALSALLMTLMFMGCGEINVFPQSAPPSPAHVSLRLQIIPVDTLNLKKISAGQNAIVLRKLLMTFTSNQKDTLRDTITANTIPALNTVSTAPQNLVKEYQLYVGRTWKVVAATQDIKDSVIQMDSATIPAFQNGDSIQITLNLTSRFVLYQISFLNIPDSVYFNGVGQALCVQRLVLKIDGVIAVDTAAAAGTCFDAPVVLSYNYVPIGTHLIELLAYGTLNGVDPGVPLFTGSSTLTSTAGGDVATNLILTWSGPSSSAASISVTISKVNKVILNGNTPVNVL